MITFLVVFLIAAFVMSAIFLHNDSTIGATLTIITTVILAKFIFASELFTSIWTFIVTQPGTLVGYAALWITLGILWSFFKWYVFVKAAKADGKTKEYLQKLEIKGRVTGWTMYWPISMTVYLSSEPVKKLYNFIYERVKGTYELIIQRVYA